jgi:cytochrome c-type biogenesis protein CcmE
MTLILGALAIFGLAAGLVLFALRDTVVFFLTPSEIAGKQIQPGVRLRVGGLVKPGSVNKGADQVVTFTVTDGQGDLVIQYQGLLPDLFREGQGVVAEGLYQGQNTFHAENVLAKHDERYMPREVAESLKAKGLWQANTGQSK